MGAVRPLLRVERLHDRIWEPARGTGNIVLPLRAGGHEVIATDLNDAIVSAMDQAQVGNPISRDQHHKKYVEICGGPTLAASTLRQKSPGRWRMLPRLAGIDQ
jgi:hypothetical protein